MAAGAAAAAVIIAANSGNTVYGENPPPYTGLPPLPGPGKTTTTQPTNPPSGDTLPDTGFAVGLVIILAVIASAVGLYLTRKSR